jgi:MFS superfamily sulfate permease-like transporter
MKNPILKFALIRLGLFAGILAIMLMLKFDPYFSALIAAVLGLAISLIFFNKHRGQLSESIYNAINNRKSSADESAEDSDSAKQ